MIIIPSDYEKGSTGLKSSYVLNDFNKVAKS